MSRAFRPSDAGYAVSNATVQNQRSMMSKLLKRASSSKATVSSKVLLLTAAVGPLQKQSVQYLRQTDLMLVWKALRPLLDAIPGSWKALLSNDEPKLAEIRESIHDTLCQQVERLRAGKLPVADPVAHDDTETDTDGEAEAMADSDSDEDYHPSPTVGGAGRRSTRAPKPRVLFDPTTSPNLTAASLPLAKQPAAAPAAMPALSLGAPTATPIPVAPTATAVAPPPSLSLSPARTMGPMGPTTSGGMPATAPPVRSVFGAMVAAPAPATAPTPAPALSPAHPTTAAPNAPLAPAPAPVAPPATQPQRVAPPQQFEHVLPAGWADAMADIDFPMDSPLPQTSELISVMREPDCALPPHAGLWAQTGPRKSTHGHIVAMAVPVCSPGVPKRARSVASRPAYGFRSG